MTFCLMVLYHSSVTWGQTSDLKAGGLSPGCGFWFLSDRNTAHLRFKGRNDQLWKELDRIGLDMREDTSYSSLLLYNSATLNSNNIYVLLEYIHVHAWTHVRTLLLDQKTSCRAGYINSSL